MCKPRSIRVLSLFFFNWGMFFPPLWSLRGRWSSYLVLNTDQTFFNSASSLIFMISFLFVWFLFSSNGLIVSLLVGMQGQNYKTTHIGAIRNNPWASAYKNGADRKNEARSRAVSTKRTILSPFTKEYRVRAAISGIRLFLEGSFPCGKYPNWTV